MVNVPTECIKTISANMQIGHLYYKCYKAKEKLESQKKLSTAEETKFQLDDVSAATSKRTRKRWGK